jgi:ribosomal protein S24E
MSKKRIHSTKSTIEATGIKRHLADHEINAMVIDKMDSAYGSVIGDIEIFVEEEEAEQAEKLIEVYFQD